MKENAGVLFELIQLLKPFDFFDPVTIGGTVSLRELIGGWENE
jgi:hypothetical protein